MLNGLMMGAGVSGVATLNFITSDVDASNSTVYTHSGLALGTSSTDRKVVIVAAGVWQGFTVSGITVDGQAASLAIAQSGTDEGVEIWQIEQATLGSAETGDVVVTLTGAGSDNAVFVYTTNGAAASTTDTFGAQGSPVSDTAFNVPAGGVAIGGGVHRTSSSTFTWIGLPDEDADLAIEAGTGYGTSASGAFPTIQTNITVSVEASSAGLRNEHGAWASWGPA